MKGLKKKIIVCFTVIVMLGGFMGFGSPTPASAMEPYLGQIETFGFNFPPRGWAFCDGQILQISSYTALFSLLGTTFGGDGRFSFGLPDLRGRVAIHPGSGPGIDRIIWGQRGGANRVTLTINEMPSHNHTATLKANNGNGNDADPTSCALSKTRRDRDYTNQTPNVDMQAGSVVVSNQGGGQAHENMQPFLGIYHSIALQGIYPSRN